MWMNHEKEIRVKIRMIGPFYTVGIFASAITPAFDRLKVGNSVEPSANSPERDENPICTTRESREEYARSKEGRKNLRERIKVEHVLGRLKRLGAGTSYYFGRTKTGAPSFWSAAVVNLSLIGNQTASAEAA